MVRGPPLCCGKSCKEKTRRLESASLGWKCPGRVPSTHVMAGLTSSGQTGRT